MTQYKEFKVTLGGNAAYFAIPMPTFEKLAKLAKRLGKSSSSMIEEYYNEYGFSSDIVDKIIEQHNS